MSAYYSFFFFFNSFLFLSAYYPTTFGSPYQVPHANKLFACGHAQFFLPTSHTRAYPHTYTHTHTYTRACVPLQTQTQTHIRHSFGFVSLALAFLSPFIIYHAFLFLANTLLVAALRILIVKFRYDVIRDTLKFEAFNALS